VVLYIEQELLTSFSGLWQIPTVPPTVLDLGQRPGVRFLHWRDSTWVLSHQDT
jgi:hypothetical protein